MALASIQNRKGFFSDYWLGTLLSARGAAGARLTSTQAKRALDRVGRLVETINGQDAPDLTQFRERFARPLLEEVLGFEMRENASEPRLRPLAVANGTSGSPVALALLLPDATEIETPRARRQLEDGLVSQALDYGIVLTPRALRLVRRPGLGARGAALDVSLVSIAEDEDIESLSAAYRLFAGQNFVAGTQGTRPIDALEAESRRHSAKVSDDLKDAVFEAAERIVGGFLTDGRSRTAEFSPLPSLSELRDAGFLALYRLLFILYAEARDERLIGHGLYQRSYSLDAIVTRLLKTPTESLPANRARLWQHLQVVFRIFNEGIASNLPELENIPPRGGRLFSEETPEGKLLRQLRLDDRQTAAILLSLATTRPRRGIGRERVSFRELDIEQLGNVYQGLLEYEPEEAEEILIECQVGGRELVLAPAELVRLVDQKSLAVRGNAAIVYSTEAARLHPDAAADDEQAEPDEGSDAEGESSDDEEEADQGVTRGATLRLLRRLEPGAFYFKPGSARKASGSYYTVTEIVDYLVRESLAPLSGGKSAAEIEALRVIDLACGSAHFLVGAARFLGPRLFEAYKREREGNPPVAFHPDRSRSADVRKQWEEEGVAWCKRRIVEKCLFGVDLNPAAVQLAQVSLWIESLAGDRPLSFFAHHIRNGNSLLGSSLANFDRPPHPKLDKRRDQQTRGMFEAELKKRLEEALAERRLIDAPLPPEVRGDTPEEYAYKEDRLRRAEAGTTQAKLLLDLRSAATFVPAIWRELPTLMSSHDLERDARSRPWWPQFEAVRERERFFHWELEFPEVFAAGGFDCVLGNPPWEKVKPDRKEFYGRADVLIRAYTGGELDARIRELHHENPTLAKEFDAYSERLKTLAASLKGGGDYRYVDWEVEGRSTGGDPDLFKFFVERTHGVLKTGGRLGYLVPSAVYNNEGCTGLRHLLLDQMKIERFYGFENRKKIFSIHSSYKFICLVAEKTASVPEHAFAAAFMRHDLDELESGSPGGVQVMVRKSEIERLSPGTLAFLEYRSECDQELVLKMYGLRDGGTPPLLLGGRGPDTWNARFYTEFHMTSDKDLWTDPATSKLWTVKQILGVEPKEFQETRAHMAEKGFWPLYQDAHIHQYVTEYKPLMRWVNLEMHERKYKELPASGLKLVIRDPARSTDERTCIAALLPERSCFGHTLNGVSLDERLKVPLLAVLNSISFDYLIRKRVGGQHVSPYLLVRAAVPNPSLLASTIKTVPRIHANERKTWIYDDPVFHEVLWYIEETVASAYGLVSDDLGFILKDFPTFSRNRMTFIDFLNSKLIEWK